MAKAVKHSAIRNFSGTSSRISENRWRMTNIILTTKTKRKTSMKKQQNNFTRGWALQIALSIALLSILAVLLTSSSEAAPFTFGNTGSLNIGRYFHTATLLPNGKVLVTGGINNYGAFSSAELYDPAHGTWSATGSLNTERGRHTATLRSEERRVGKGGV